MVIQGVQIDQTRNLVISSVRSAKEQNQSSQNKFANLWKLNNQSTLERES